MRCDNIYVEAAGEGSGIGLCLIGDQFSGATLEIAVPDIPRFANFFKITVQVCANEMRLYVYT